MCVSRLGLTLKKIDETYENDQEDTIKQPQAYAKPAVALRNIF
jgi:hypothetical protein